MAFRSFGKTTLNESFNVATVEAVWKNGVVVPGSTIFPASLSMLAKLVARLLQR